MNKNMILFLIISMFLIINLFFEARSNENYTTQALTKDNNSFALNLYSKLAKQKGNIFFSPYSISSVMLMTYGGLTRR